MESNEPEQNVTPNNSSNNVPQVGERQEEGFQPKKSLKKRNLGYCNQELLNSAVINVAKKLKTPSMTIFLKPHFYAMRIICSYNKINFPMICLLSW